MKVKCAICGKEEEIGKIHKDYKKMAANPSAMYFCDLCSKKLSSQAAKNNAIFGKK